MEITKENLQAQLPSLEEAIERCEFLSFDGEMTGITLDYKEERLHALDTVEQRYQKLCASAQNFLTIQWGLCAFIPEGDGYKAEPFNFYLFPKPFRKGAEQYFLSQVSSIHFLAANGFDFNKLIYHGIPWLTREEEERQRPKQEPTSPLPPSDIVLNEKDKEFLKPIHTMIEEWLQSSTEQALQLAPCNSYQRRLLYQEIGKRYNNRLHVEAHSVENTHLRRVSISRMTEEEKSQWQREQLQHSMDELEEAIGFRKVLEMLIRHRKPLVGHNMLLDLLHLFSFIYQLPSTVFDFKAKATELFPCILDTKYLATASDHFKDLLPSTSLEDLYRTFNSLEHQSKPTVELSDRCAEFNTYSIDTSRFHEAGFDAFITGLSYIRMLHKIALEENWQSPLTPASGLLDQYVNKLYLMRSDIPYFQMNGLQEPPDRSNVFYVFGFDSALRTTDIVRHFEDFSRVFVTWLDNTSLLVALEDKEQSQRVIPHFQTLPSPPFHILDYDTYQHMFAQHSASPSSFISITSEVKQPLSHKRKRSTLFTNEKTEFAQPIRKKVTSNINEEKEEGEIVEEQKHNDVKEK
ncbi:CAF1-domain-containing protein [Balamuthia mandrillaris]